MWEVFSETKNLCCWISSRIIFPPIFYPWVFNFTGKKKKLTWSKHISFKATKFDFLLLILRKLLPPFYWRILLFYWHTVSCISLWILSRFHYKYTPPKSLLIISILRDPYIFKLSGDHSHWRKVGADSGCKELNNLTLILRPVIYVFTSPPSFSLLHLLIYTHPRILKLFSQTNLSNINKNWKQVYLNLTSMPLTKAKVLYK